jgi:3-methylcrotonyl-CoA carboxylase alpha subunit
VEKDQPLVVIESMKMETVIRSPQQGTIARVVHKQGVSHSIPSFENPRLTWNMQDQCKSGTPLVEFTESE